MNWDIVLTIVAICGVCLTSLGTLYKIISNHLAHMEARLNIRIDEVRRDVYKLEQWVIKRPARSRSQK